MAEEKDDILGINDPDDQDIEGDQTPDPDLKDKKDDDDTAGDGEAGKKPVKSDIAQKIKYREKFKAESEKVQKLEADLEKFQGMKKVPTDEAEARAQKYIRDQAKEVFEELGTAKSKKDKAAQQIKEDLVAEILEDNSDISEETLLETMEDYEVEPKVALKILKKAGTTKKPKPKMPEAKRASASDDNKGKSDDSKKNMWEIAKEEAEKVKNK